MPEKFSVGRANKLSDTHYDLMMEAMRETARAMAKIIDKGIMKGKDAEHRCDLLREAETVRDPHRSS